MSIKWKLAVSYLVLVLVPLILGFIGLLIVSIALIGRIPSFNESVKPTENRLLAIFDQELSTYASIHDVVLDSPDDLLIPKRLNEWEGQLADWRIGLLIWKNGKLVHRSPILSKVNADTLFELEHKQSLIHPPFSENDSKEEPMHLRGDVVKSWQVRFMDGASGEVYLVSDNGSFVHLIGKSFGWFLIGLLLVFVGTMSFLVWRVSITMIRPLLQLTEATGRIKTGDLFFELNMKRSDEIGRLANSIDQMRLKLQSASEQTIRDEHNRKELLANISHDLRTPVTAIRGYAEAMVDGLIENRDIKLKYAEQIVKKSQQLQHLIQELFDLSLMEMGKKTFQFEPVDIVAFLRDCSEELQLDVQEREIRIVFVVDDRSDSLDLESRKWDNHSSILIRADRAELQRVMMNVLDNSIKSLQGSPGNVIIRLKFATDSVMIRVEDEGCGISEDLLPAIFDRFTRADASRGSRGAGLGLAIAKQVIDAHGGKIDAVSEVGKGTIISITLPYWSQNPHNIS